MKHNHFLSAALMAFPSFTSAFPASSMSLRDDSAMHSKHHFRRALDPSTVHYRAFGDSYSAGPGAGTSLEGKAAGDCRQFSGAYPHQLNEFLRPGQALAPEDFVSCTGAVSAQIAGQAKAHMNKDIKFATVSLGGNDVGFAKIVNNCVYRFINFFHAGGYGEDCGKTLDESENKIENDLAREVENALLEFHKASADDAIIVVTGYGQFWNQDTEQCDQSNWNYWKNPFANRTPMTKALRGRMNKMVQDVNGKINGVVDKINSEANTSKFRFVNYNSGFDNSRFCEQHWEEPQKKEDEPRRDEMVLGQYYTKPGQIAPDQDKMPQTGEWVEFADAFAAEIRNSTQADVNPDYAAVSSDDLADGLIPISIVRVFHPTQRGHTKIAEAVRDTLLEQGDWPKANEQPEPQAQVACKYEHKFLDPNEHYDIVFRDFTDFDRLKNELKRCPLIVSHFKATEENIYAFKGDLPSQWHVVFAATWSDGSCFAKKIEAAMGLPEGHLKCPNSRTFFEREA